MAIENVLALVFFFVFFGNSISGLSGLKNHSQYRWIAEEGNTHSIIPTRSDLRNISWTTLYMFPMVVKVAASLRRGRNVLGLYQNHVTIHK